MKYTIELTWNDESKTMFEVELTGENHKVMSTLMWITRGTLMASNAKRSTAYDEAGFYVLSYTK